MEGGRRTCATDRTDLIAHQKAVPIPASGIQPVDFDVHTMPELLGGPHAAFLHWGVEVFVVGNFPVHFHPPRLHAAPSEGFGGEPRPEHHAVELWTPRCHPEGERIPGESDLCTR